jgi:hypothetical protein
VIDELFGLHALTLCKTAKVDNRKQPSCQLGMAKDPTKFWKARARRSTTNLRAI